MNRKLAIFLGFFVIAAVLITMGYGLFFASDPNEIPSAQIGKVAKQFAATTFEGEKISLQQFRGRPVILNFWASWCISCRHEARIVEAAHQKFTPLGAVFIGIAINDTREASLGFIRRYGKTYLLAPDDLTGTISLDYGVTAVPETFLIDKNGMISNKVLGAISKKTITDFLEQQLK